MRSVSLVTATLLAAVAIHGVATTPANHLHRDHYDTALASALPQDMAARPDSPTSVTNVTEELETRISTIPSTEVEEGRGRKKKKYKKFLIHSFWNLMYYYAWFVGIIIIKFKAVLLFLLGNLTFFVVALIRVLIKEVPMWNYLKKASPAPTAVYGPPQYKYGPPATNYGPPAANYGPPSPTYGTPATNYDNSYSDVGLYKRQGGSEITNNAHDMAYSGQRK